MIPRFRKEPKRDEDLTSRKAGASWADLREAIAALHGSPNVRHDTARRDSRNPCADLEIAEQPSDPEEYLRFLAQVVVPGSLNVSAPGYLASMTSGVPPVLQEVGSVVQALNQNLVRADASPMLSWLERQTLAALHRLTYRRPDAFYKRSLENPDAILGAMTSGGSLANLMGLWCARSRMLCPCPGFAGVEEDGLPAAMAAHGLRRAVVIGSDQMHYSLDKAMALMGLGSGNVLRLPLDARQRLVPAAIRDTLETCRDKRWGVIAVVGVAGSTVYGAIDSLSSIAELCRDFGVHFHVDASWGGVLLLSKTYRHLLDGIGEADTVALDAHKQFQVPIGVGLTLFRDSCIAGSVSRTANYILHADSEDLGKVSVEGSRPGTSLMVHAALKVLGSAGLVAPVERQISLARNFADMIDVHPAFELLARPQTNIVVYRCVHNGWRETLGAGTSQNPRSLNELNRRVHEIQAGRGRALVSRTLVPHPRANGDGRVVALRAVLVQDGALEIHLREVLDEQCALAEEIESKMQSEQESPSDV